MSAASTVVCPWTGNVTSFDTDGRRLGPACPFMSKEQGMNFDVLVLGSTATSRPHVFKISGYPPGLSALDFLELAEAGKTFGSITLMEGLTWSQMVLRLHGEAEPLPKNQSFNTVRDSRVVIEPDSFALLGVDLPDRKRPCNMPNIKKSWKVSDLKKAIALLHNLYVENPCGVVFSPRPCVFFLFVLLCPSSRFRMRHAQAHP